jgi:isovaleryl-CoA dehydrogenase
MDFELPEEHQLAYESAFAFARDEIRPHNAEIERSDDFPRWMWKKLAILAWLFPRSMVGVEEIS